MKHYRYIHLLWGHDLKFNGPLVKMINNTPDIFNSNEHLFITPNKNVANALHLYPNVIWDNDGTESKIINRYADSCDWILSHGLVNNPYKIKRKYFKKIVWRTWGGGRQRTKWNEKRPLNSLVSSIKDYVYFVYYRYSFGCSPVIGIANTVDVIDLEQWRWAKNAKLFLMGYSDSSYDKILDNITIEKKRQDEPLVFLIGHQGNPGEHHFEFTKMILNYNKDNIRIILPLSYGNKEYIELLKEKLKNLNDERIHVLDNLLPINEYLQLLAKVDVAIIDEKSSMALGNIAFLLRFKKKIFLNKDSIIKQAFDHENLPYSLTSEIGTVSFEDLVRPMSYPKETSSDLIFQPYSVRVQRYVSLFSYLDKISTNG